MKNKWTNIILYTALGLLGCFVFSIFRPIPQVPETQCLSLEGEVTKVYTWGAKDIVLELDNNSTKSYYINRGEQQGFTVDALQKELKNKNVTIKYAKHWTLLDPNQNSIHIAKLETAGAVVYSEF